MTATNLPPSLPSLDGLEFAMTSSTGSAVSPDAPSRFRYFQRGAMVWGDYRGDTVRVGRFVGRREADSITIGFAHAPSGGGDTVLGTATSRLVRDSDGRLLLVEDFEKDGVAHQSTCVQVEPSAEPEPVRVRSSDPLSLDASTFVLETSTASTVDPDAPTRFSFSEDGGVVWGDYDGDTVTGGFCVGARVGATLTEYFVHELVATGQTLMGDSTTTIRAREDGVLELIEEFELAGVAGHSVCVQVRGE